MIEDKIHFDNFFNLSLEYKKKILRNTTSTFLRVLTTWQSTSKGYFYHDRANLYSAPSRVVFYYFLDPAFFLTLIYHLL